MGATTAASYIGTSRRAYGASAAKKVAPGPEFALNYLGPSAAITSTVLTMRANSPLRFANVMA
ncbi:MAG: hypothetical protein WCA91_14125 [Candidatus Acidiferrales bacterium]